MAVDLDALLDSLVGSVSPDDDYRSPTAPERDAASTGLARLAIGDLLGAAELLQPLGFKVSDGVDQGSGRPFAVATSESDSDRKWGYYVADLRKPLRLSVVVPHPRFDRRCEQLALRLWRRVPGSILAVAAVHRDAVDTASSPPGQLADHARNTSSLFHHHWTDVLGPRGVPQIQIHGFADTTAPEQVAVSTGAGLRTPAAVRIADEIAAIGLNTTRSWDGTADGDLLARTNEQGKAAHQGGWVWVHVEHNRSVRDSPRLWEPAVDAIAAADPTLIGQQRPSSVVLIGDDEPIIVDAARGSHFRVTLGRDRTLAPPVNAVDGQTVRIEVLAEGNQRTLTLDSSIMRTTGVVSPVTVASDNRWIAEMTFWHDAGWLVVLSALQE